jgi:hypothetical protein
VLLTSSRAAEPAHRYQLSPVPAGKDPFYRKHVRVGGFSILASEKVADQALKGAAFIIEGLLKGRGDLLKAIADNGVHLAASPVVELDAVRPKKGGKRVPIFFYSRSKGSRNLYWIDFEGKRRNRQTLRVGDHADSQTFVGHPWLVTDAKDRPPCLYYPGPDRGIVILR